MKKFLLGSVAAVSIALSASTAQPADLMDAPTGYDWSGSYAGANFGYGWGDTTPDVEFGGTREFQPLDYDGIVFGGQFGHNWQANSFVFGIEVDGSISDISGFAQGAARPCSAIGCTASVDAFMTARGRLGFAVDRLMPFVTGGLAVGRVTGTFDSPGLACSCSVDDTLVGWTVGGGVEYAIDDTWSAKIEYLYVNLGTASISGDNTLAPPPGDGVGTGDYDFSVVRVGINFNL